MLHSNEPLVPLPCIGVGCEIPTLVEEVNDSKLDVFQEELKLLSKSARVS